MWAELSCFLSSGDGYVGELLEVQQGCEGPKTVSKLRINFQGDFQIIQIFTQLPLL